MTLTHVTDDSFDNDVVKASAPVLVDYWAEWCAPCKQIAPALEEIAAEMEGRMVVAKMNIDDNPTTPTKFGVPRHPDPDAVQGRAGRLHQGRRAAQEQDRGVDRIGDLIPATSR